MKLLRVLAGCCPFDAPIKLRNGRPAPVPAAWGRAMAPTSPSLPFTEPFTALHGKAPSVPTSQGRRLSPHGNVLGGWDQKLRLQARHLHFSVQGSLPRNHHRGNSRSHQILFFPNPEEQPPKNSTSTEFLQREGARPLASYSNVWFNVRAQEVLCF